MGMTIDEIIDDFDYIKHVGNGEFSYRHCREEIALNEAEIIMRKYKKVEEIVKEWREVGLDYDSCDAMDNIERVIEDGDNCN